MAILGSSYWDLIDTIRLTNSDVADVTEVLAQLNPFLIDANVITCNDGTAHKSSMRTGLPSVAWGALYQGTPISKGNYTDVKDETGFVEGLSSVDKRLLDLQPGNAAKLRLLEGVGFMEQMAQTVESAIWYSDVRVNGKQFHGLAPRYSTLSTNSTNPNPQVIPGGGVGSDNTSIWFVTHGDLQTSVITPENIPGGVQREDMGVQRALDSQNNPYYVKEEKFTQHIGLSVRDWRYNARIANIDVSNVIAGTVALNPLMRHAYYKLQGRRAYKVGMDEGGKVSPGRTVVYMNRTMLEALDAEGTNGRSGADNFIRLTPMEIQGVEVMTWRGIPIRETDSIINTETLLS